MARPVSKSFYDWCIENERQDILQLWDYELNDCTPKDVGCRTEKKYYFKCFRGIHKSELKRIDSIVANNSIKCNQCNSFGQYLLDEFGGNALEKYWDYNKNTVNPFEIPRCSDRKVWIKCQEKEYHESYEIRCHNFYNGYRCPYCCCFHGKVHPKDSFGQRLIDNYGNDAIEKYWSKKNIIDPFKLAIYSEKKIWIICQKDEEHEDYEITCSNFTGGRRCPKCNESKGERQIKKHLKTNKVNFIPQKEFTDLVGTSEWKPLSYDFYIPEHNLLIEYQGEYHDGTAKNQTEEQFIKQQEHDRRKRKYAELHNIKLLEIWYWDYKNIIEILNKELGLS